MNNVEMITNEVIKRLFIPVEASGRHVHLTKEDVIFLFGENHELTPIKALSQPGQYACRERVTVRGGKGEFESVVVLGPPRKETQLEISKTDARILGVDAPVRLSGDIKETPGFTISYFDRCIYKRAGVIVAKRHIHMSEADARHFGVNNGDKVKLKVFGQRSITFNETIVRVSSKFATYAHIDYDEANACGFTNDMLGLLIK